MTEFFSQVYKSHYNLGLHDPNFYLNNFAFMSFIEGAATCLQKEKQNVTKIASFISLQCC
jgi:hypothetical protein